MKVNILKNQKSVKLRKMHMKSILCEVKNKFEIEELERESDGFDLGFNCKLSLGSNACNNKKNASNFKLQWMQKQSIAPQRIALKSAKSKSSNKNSQGSGSN